MLEFWPLIMHRRFHVGERGWQLLVHVFAGVAESLLNASMAEWAPGAIRRRAVILGARIAGQAVLRGEIAYAGMSAGASVASADLAFYQAPDDPGSVETTEGLGLIGFFPLVHANRGRQERYARLIAAYGDRYEFVPINDDEAVTVTGEAWQRQA